MDEKELNALERAVHMQNPWPRRATTALALINSCAWIAVAVQSLYVRDMSRVFYANVFVFATMIFLALREKY